MLSVQIQPCFQFKKWNHASFYSSFEMWAELGSRIKTLKSISEISVVQVHGGFLSNCKLSLWASTGREVNSICTKVSKINDKQQESSSFQALQSSQDQYSQTSQLKFSFFHLIHTISACLISICVWNWNFNWNWIFSFQTVLFSTGSIQDLLTTLLVMLQPL